MKTTVEHSWIEFDRLAGYSRLAFFVRIRNRCLYGHINFGWDCYKASGSFGFIRTLHRFDLGKKIENEYERTEYERADKWMYRNYRDIAQLPTEIEQMSFRIVK
jgi:hypothetical protein